ncbi:MAG: sterol carrier protein domain-containing protein, partial [Cyanobacteria bacterium]|nr:sterol carrier protein domain-containing protein [Cyanobacteriota bacterium]MDW8201833.1 sterol carrier protein domain-containing protein [Cyanobacteriota bacterium SKYGB_h_bin112]
SLAYAYLLGHLDHPEGYLVMKQHRDGSNSIIQVRDWALLTPAAVHTFWTFLANQRSQCDVVRWQSAAIDPLSLVLPEPSAHVDHADCWLLRLINLPLALEQRGYPPHIEAELHLSVFDDLLSPNNGNFLLIVTGGRGTVCPGGRGDLQVHIRGLASLYSSLLSPYQLRAVGLLEGTDAHLATAASVFGGASPWLPDFF